MKALVVLALALLTGCTAYVHPPDVTVARQHADLEQCRLEAMGLGASAPILVPGRATIALAATGVGLAASEIDNFRRENRTIACMRARGYVVAAWPWTFHRDGWRP